MSGFEWFDSYNGPKRLEADSSQATCWIGYNEHDENGRVVGREFTVKTPTLWQTLSEASAFCADLEQPPAEKEK